MTLDQTVRIVQASYPQVYLACHTRHQRKRSTAHRLSSRDATILAHLDEHVPRSPGRLATHLGIARSTLSEALKRLVALGHVLPVQSAGGDAEQAPQSTATSSPGRTQRVVLSALGARAVRDTSVLETARLRAVLAQIPERERRAIAQAMARLASACREFSEAGDAEHRT